jgi:hypothetical protein
LQVIYEAFGGSNPYQKFIVGMIFAVVFAIMLFAFAAHVDRNIKKKGKKPRDDPSIGNDM